MDSCYSCESFPPKKKTQTMTLRHGSKLKGFGTDVGHSDSNHSTFNMLQASASILCGVSNLTRTIRENKHGARPWEAQLPVGCWACCQSKVFLRSQVFLHTLSPTILNGSKLHAKKMDGSVIKCSSYLKLSTLWWCHMFEPSSIDKGSFCGWPPLLARSKYGMGTSAHRKGDSKESAGTHGPIHTDSPTST